MVSTLRNKERIPIFPTLICQNSQIFKVDPVKIKSPFKKNPWILLIWNLDPQLCLFQFIFVPMFISFPLHIYKYMYNI